MRRIMAILALATAPYLHAQDMPPLETDMFKYIPKGETVYMMDTNGDGLFDTYWWDRNKDEKPQKDEIFLDFNEDGIPDMSLPEFEEWYKEWNSIKEI